MKKNKKQGLFVVISGPSGVGKSSVRKALFKKFKDQISYSVSMTTRPIRRGEKEGSDYYFVSKEEFENKIKEDAFIEYAEFCGNYYGTLKSEIDALLKSGKDVILEIEVEGAQQVMEKNPEGIFIFVMPPTKDAIEKRLMKRKTDEQNNIDLRLKKANNEYKVATKYNYIVVNDQIKNAVEKIMTIINAEHNKTKRVIDDYKLIFDI